MIIHNQDLGHALSRFLRSDPLAGRILRVQQGVAAVAAGAVGEELFVDAEHRRVFMGLADPVGGVFEVLRFRIPVLRQTS